MEQPASVSAFEERLRTLERIPVSLSMELTERCNLNCQHCYINLPADDKAARQRELSTEDMIRLIDEMADAGALWLLMTGGEVMLRSDFETIYLHARNRGIIITLYTNATLITPKRAAFFAEYPPFLLEVTIYGATAATYEAVTRVPGSFARCMEGLEALYAQRLPVTLKTVVLTLNQHELLDMKAIADSHGWPFRYDAMIHPRLNGDRSPTALRLEPQAIAALEQLDLERAQEWTEFCTSYLGQQVKGGERTFTCGAAKNTAHVDSYGMISPCMITRTRAIDWRSSDFQEIWDGYMADMRDTRNEEATACHSCSLSLVCTNCPGWSTLERNTVENRPIEWVCDSTKARVATFSPEAAQWLEGAICLDPSFTAGKPGPSEGAIR